MRISPILLLLAACSQKLQSPDTDQSDADTDADADTDTEDTQETDTEDTDVAPTWEAATIPAIQKGDVATGTAVDVTGAVITGVTEYGVYASTPEGGEYSGIWVYMGRSGADWTSSDHHRGDVVEIKGEVREYEDTAYPGDTLTEIFVKYSRGDGLTASGTAAEPAPAMVDASDITDDPERWESVLVRLQSPRVDSYDDAHGSWTLDGVPVGTTFYTKYDVYPGDTFTYATGIAEYVFGRFQLDPRDADDLVGYGSVVVRAADVVAGDLYVTEIMADPEQSGCEPESEGEYIELYNASSSAIDLEGLQIGDTTRTEAIEDRAVIQPGEYALGVAFPTSNWCHPGVTPAFEYDLNWNNDGDVLTLSNSATIDAVDFEDWKFGMPPVGASMALGEGFDGLTNDLEASWCASTSEIEPGGDKGTPGAKNDSCKP